MRTMAQALTASDLLPQVGEEDLAKGSIYPPLKNIREVCGRVRARVACVRNGV